MRRSERLLRFAYDPRRSTFSRLWALRAFGVWLKAYNLRLIYLARREGHSWAEIREARRG